MSEGAFTHWNRSGQNPLKVQTFATQSSRVSNPNVKKQKRLDACDASASKNLFEAFSSPPGCFENAGGKSALGWVANLETTGYPPHPPFFEASAVEKVKTQTGVTNKTEHTQKTWLHKLGLLFVGFSFGFDLKKQTHWSVPVKNCQPLLPSYGEYFQEQGGRTRESQKHTSDQRWRNTNRRATEEHFRTRWHNTEARTRTSVGFLNLCSKNRDSLHFR